MGFFQPLGIANGYSRNAPTTLDDATHFMATGPYNHVSTTHIMGYIFIMKSSTPALPGSAIAFRNTMRQFCVCRYTVKGGQSAVFRKMPKQKVFISNLKSGYGSTFANSFNIVKVTTDSTSDI